MTACVVRRVAFLAAVLVTVAGGLVHGQRIAVTVDGQALETSAPPREIEGRILVGMRDIFERLGAQVKWNEAEQMITATRGTRTIILWIGRTYAQVDGATIPLDVPPKLIDGYTYVPVRFPSEALGADVTWLSATRTVLISTKGMPGIETPPSAGGKTVKGVLLELKSTPRSVTVKVDESGATQTYMYGASAAFARGEWDATELASALPQELRPGDDVTITMKEGGRIERVEARTRTVRITLDSATGDRLRAGGGEAYPLSSGARIHRRGAGNLAVADLKPGDDLRLGLNPTTGEVWEVTVEAGGAPQPSGGGEIKSIRTEGYTRPLRAGQTLTAVMAGTPGGQATFDIGGERLAIPMAEDQAGVYRGRYNVQADDEIVEAPLIGHLIVRGAPSPDRASTDRVSLDSVAPKVRTVVPRRNADLAIDTPTIQGSFDDGNGTGIDRDSVTLTVRGRDVTREAIVTEDSVTYYSPDLSLGEVPVRVRVADLAGNETETAWRFRLIAGERDRFIHSVTHLPGGIVLGVGDTLVVTMRTQRGGRKAWFAIQGLHGIRRDHPMTRRAGRDYDLWQSTYRVEPGDVLRNAHLTGWFVDQRGVTHSREDPEPVDIVAREKLVVHRPADGARVPTEFQIVGTALPGRRLDIEVRYEAHWVWFNAPTSGLVAQRRITVGSDGRWSVRIDTGPVRRNPSLAGIERFRINCELRGLAGAVIDVAKLSVFP